MKYLVGFEINHPAFAGYFELTLTSVSALCGIISRNDIKNSVMKNIIDNSYRRESDEIKQQLERLTRQNVAAIL